MFLLSYCSCTSNTQYYCSIVTAIGQQDSVPDHDNELNAIVDAELLPQIGEARGRDSNKALLQVFINRHFN
ncbi:unnamed protein product [Parnassius mnemosyne]|uniref:Uncharacterized protein n=1 Tax=Parnassius mnemosyne TaxID=213953 RepID=A0AAV1L8A1_9NEOP